MTLHKPNSMSTEEANNYINYLQEKYHRTLNDLTIELDENDPDYVGLTYTFNHVPFERIRRITGYLVGTMDNWNDAKTAEEADRVKHSIGTQPEKLN
jgi:hypothetical protein